MTSEPPHATGPDSWKFKQTFRVNYYETDGQRRVHHSNYLKYFERGRIEMLREAGIQYKDLEDDGFMLVVTEMNLRYQAAAEFDDLLTLTTTVTSIGKVRIKHHYTIDRDDQMIIEADSTIACIGKTGKPTRLPACFHRS